MENPHVTVKVSVQILPFAHKSIQVSIPPTEEQARQEALPVYRPPTTTSPTGGYVLLTGDDYRVPQTTGGLM